MSGHQNSNNALTDSAVVRRRRLYAMIRNEDLGHSVLEELLPNGKPHEYEKQLWDYKGELPSLPSDRRPTDDERRAYEIKMAGIVKDAAAFYNSYGGYLVIGVKDSPREVVGFKGAFDCDELNKKLKGATKHEIDCHYATHEIDCGDRKLKIGLLLMPQRPDERAPAQFLKDGGVDGSRKAYGAGDIPFRVGHECRPAKTADELSFLCSQRRRQIVAPQDEVGLTTVLDNNLGSRDPGFVKFVGRGILLAELWRWLCDRYIPVKLLAGLGGVGKTTLAREFAEEIVRGSPLRFERVIWLSAKKRFYTPSLNEYVLATRVDFSDTESLLRALLLQLGYNESDLDPEWTRAELMDEAIRALRLIPSFLVIDDVDALEPQDEQSELFHTVLQIIGHTMGGAHAPTRAILTARLSLGASAGQLMRVSGLELKDFEQYVRMTAEALSIPLNVLGSHRDIERFHKVTEGSPTFAASVLRLIELGESLRSALDAWKGSDGEEVRRFAFQKELEMLTDSQVRTLYVLCLLGETSQLELRQITQSSDSLLRDDLGELRKYHLLVLESELPGGGPRLRVPEAIRLMAALIKERIRDPKYLENECAKARKGAPRLGVGFGEIIHRVLALWRDEKPNEALEQVKFVVKRHPKNADLQCLLGRAFLRLEPPEARSADKAFREAYRMGCERVELIGLWTEAKKLLGDWLGLVEVSRLADERDLSADSVFYRAEAYGELAAGALLSGNISLAAEHYLTGAREIDRAFAERRAVGRVPELKDMRYTFMHNHVQLIDRMASVADRHLEVWLAVVDAFKFFVRSSGLVLLGVDRLISWWIAVENRERIDGASAGKLAAELRRLDEIINACRMQDAPDRVLVDKCVRASESLAVRLEAYRRNLK